MSQNGSAYAETRNMNTVHILFRREFGLMPDLVESVAHGTPGARRPSPVTSGS